MKPDIYNCSSLFDFQCPKHWDSLSETSEVNIRHCPECEKNVHFCLTPREFVRLGEAGECVAVPAEITIKPDDSPPDETLGLAMLGLPSMEALREMKAQHDRFVSWWTEVSRRNPEMPEESETLAQVQAMLERQRRLRVEEEKELARFRADLKAAEAHLEAEEERRLKLQAEVEKIVARSSQENWGKRGRCPKCGFSYRWDGTRCAHCRHELYADNLS